MTLHNLDVAIALAVVMLGVSLLITILTQLIATVLSSRGTTLRFGLENLFKTVLEKEGPAIYGHARELAEEVLKHRLISDSYAASSWVGKIWLVNKLPFVENFGLATAVRAEEMIGILHQLAPPVLPPPAPGAAPATLTDREKALRKLVDTALKVTPQVAAVATQAAEVVQKVEAALAAGGGAAAGAGIPGQMQISVDRLLQDVPTTAEAFLGPNIKDWFNCAMDRASQQFALKMRMFTVVCAVAAAFALHLDTFRFLTQVSNDPELRAALVNTSQAMQNQAAAILATPAPAAGNQPPAPEIKMRGVSAIYVEALSTTATENKDKVPALASVPEAAAKKHFGSRAEALQWLGTLVTDTAEAKDIFDKFEVNVDTILAKSSPTDRLLDQAASIRGSLDSAGFQLIPNPYHGWDFWPGLRFGNLHFWGILFSAGLLSLGAPFWFNALKTMSSLRPIVASKEEQERQGS